jgi:hypothetical protein
MFNAQDYEELVVKLAQWVESLPDPDTAIIGFGVSDQEALSPRQIVDEVRKRTPFGEAFAANFLKKTASSPEA